MLKKINVNAELFNRNGRVVQELESVPLDRDVIRLLRDTGYHFAGYLTMYRQDGTTTRMYFDDTMNIIPTLNNLLEEVSHA